MDLLLLGGNSIDNKPWIHEVEASLSALFNKCLVHEYAHWDSPNKNIDIESELNLLKTETKELNNYMVFAKSIGIYLSITGIERKVLTPIKCFFAGLPLSLLRRGEINIDTFLANSQIPLIFIQNTADPIGSANEIEDYLSKINNNHMLVKIVGSDHHYSDIKKLTDVISKNL